MNDLVVEVLHVEQRGARVPWAVAVRAADNLATRTIVTRQGKITEESFAARGLVLWSSA